MTAKRLQKFIKSSMARADILEEIPHLRQKHDELLAKFQLSDSAATFRGESELKQAQAAIFDEARQLKMQRELESALAETKTAHDQASLELKFAVSAAEFHKNPEKVKRPDI